MPGALCKLKGEASGDLQGKTVAFQDPEPWDEAVDGDALLCSIVAYLKRFIVLPAHTAEALALWVLHTWIVSGLEITPYLAVTSATKRCAKSLVLDVISFLVRRPLSVGNVTTATVFRSVEEFGPTLLIDEADTALRDNNELRTLINGGFSRAFSCVPRCEGDNNKTRLFDSFCAKSDGRFRGRSRLAHEALPGSAPGRRGHRPHPRGGGG